MMVLTVSAAYGQHRSQKQSVTKQHQEQPHKPGRSNGSMSRQHSQGGPAHRPGGSSRGSVSHGGYSQRGSHRGAHRGGIRVEIACVDEWQDLWNGCHVRLDLVGQVSVYDNRDNRIIWGDEIYLLPNGNYKVRRGSLWRIYERDGDMTFISGDEIQYWPSGYYCVRFGSLWRVYDPKGDQVFGISSRNYIEQLWNGCFLYEQGGNYYVADRKGDRIFGVWGESVELMNNGLFRCLRSGHYYYYDEDGNQRM